MLASCIYHRVKPTLRVQNTGISNTKALQALDVGYSNPHNFEVN